MKKKHMVLWLLMIAFGRGALAQGAPTRAQVLSEARQAERAGQLPIGDLDRTRVAQAPAASGPTRAQVEQDAQRARKAGELPIGDLDRTKASKKTASSSTTREQVKSELKQAQRAGDVQVGDSGKTLAEEDPARYAGAPASVPKLHLRHPSRKATAASATKP